MIAQEEANASWYIFNFLGYNNASLTEEKVSGNFYYEQI